MSVNSTNSAKILVDRLQLGSDFKVKLLLHGAERHALGGPGLLVPKTAKALRDIGVAAEDGWLGRVADIAEPCVHLFNIWSPDTSLTALRALRRAGKRVVFSPIWLDLQFSAIWADVAAPELMPAWSRYLGQLAKRQGSEITAGYFAMAREMLSLADHVIFLSAAEREAMALIGAKVEDNRASVIPNAVDFTAWQGGNPETFRSAYLGGDAADYVLSISRIEPRKNQLLLARAMRDLPMKLVFVGHDGDPQYSERLRREAGPNTIFAGRMENGGEMMRAALAGARAFALPSWAEGMPMVALEAAAAGVPVVLADRPSERASFGGLASYCNPADPADIRRAILEACAVGAAHIDLLQEHVAREFDWPTHALATARAYAKAMSSPQSPMPTPIVIRQPRSAVRLAFDATDATRSGGNPKWMRFARHLEDECGVQLLCWAPRVGRFVEVSIAEIERGLRVDSLTLAELSKTALAAVQPGVRLIAPLTQDVAKLQAIEDLVFGNGADVVFLLTKNDLPTDSEWDAPRKAGLDRAASMASAFFLMFEEAQDVSAHKQIGALLADLGIDLPMLDAVDGDATAQTALALSERVLEELPQPTLPAMMFGQIARAGFSSERGLLGVGTDWHPAEPWGRWAAQESAKLRLNARHMLRDLPLGADKLWVLVRLAFPPVWDGKSPRLQIACDSEVIFDSLLQGPALPADVLLTINREHVSPEGDLTLNFIYPVGPEMSGQMGGRLIGLGLQSVQVFAPDRDSLASAGSLPAVWASAKHSLEFNLMKAEHRAVVAQGLNFDPGWGSGSQNGRMRLCLPILPEGQPVRLTVGLRAVAKPEHPVQALVLWNGKVVGQAQWEDDQPKLITIDVDGMRKSAPTLLEIVSSSFRSPHDLGLGSNHSIAGLAVSDVWVDPIMSPIVDQQDTQGAATLSLFEKPDLWPDLAPGLQYGRLWHVDAVPTWSRHHSASLTMLDSYGAGSDLYALRVVVFGASISAPRWLRIKGPGACEHRVCIDRPDPVCVMIGRQNVSHDDMAGEIHLSLDALVRPDPLSNGQRDERLLGVMITAAEALRSPAIAKLNFSDPSVCAHWLKGGWDSPLQDQGVWSIGSIAQIAVEPEQGICMRLVLSCLPRPDSMQPLLLEVEAGVLREYRLVGAGPHILDIPLEDMAAKSCGVMTMRFASVESPAELGINSDTRPLGVFLIRAELRGV